MKINGDTKNLLPPKYFRSDNFLSARNRVPACTLGKFCTAAN